jgi:tRNA pseudouridine38-40 synthase
MDIMKNACKELEGINDFVNFFKKENNEKQTKRRLDLAEMSVQKNRLIFDFKSKSFLRQQIRRMVKKILELGKGEINYDDFLNLLNPKNYYSYQPADPSGLILWDIIYDNSIQFQVDLKSKERMENYFLSQKRKYQQKYELFNILQHSDFS